MKKCPKCDREFDPYSKWGERKFCSRKCANSRAHSADVKAKISNGVKQQFASLTVEEQNKRREQSRTLMTEINKKRSEFGCYCVDGSRNPYAQRARKPADLIPEKWFRKKVIAEQDYKCNRCKLDTWLGQPLVLELEHKDGDNKNNNRENLEYLCPNCHSLTPTWRGRNKKGMSTPAIPIEGYKSIRQYLIAHGLTPKGGNYKALKKKLGLI